MKLHLITVGEPKLAYAKAGWQEYLSRLERYHTISVNHIADRQNDAPHILRAADKKHIVALTINGKQFDSPGLASFLEERAIEAVPVCFIIGGPDGLPAAVIAAAYLEWSLSKLTFPHDLAMVILLEALYRASTINSRHPYHK